MPLVVPVSRVQRKLFHPEEMLLHSRTHIFPDNVKNFLPTKPFIKSAKSNTADPSGTRLRDVWLSISQGCSQGSSGTAVLAKPDSTETDSLQSHSEDCGQDSVPPSLLTGCWSKDHPQFFVTSASPESSSQIVTCFIRGSEKLQREKMSKKDITVFCSLISG